MLTLTMSLNYTYFSFSQMLSRRLQEYHKYVAGYLVLLKFHLQQLRFLLVRDHRFLLNQSDRKNELNLYLVNPLHFELAMITSSASAPTTILALCVTTMICRTAFFFFMNGINCSKIDRLSRSSSG